MGGAWLCARLSLDYVYPLPLALEVLVRMRSLVLLTTGQLLGEP